MVIDLRITLASSRQPWRLVAFNSRREHVVEFLTNDSTLEPGVVAFLYSRRWEEEKCFGTWKNDFTQAKAWGKSCVAIESQVRLAIIIPGMLIAIMLHTTMGQHGIADEKTPKKQDKRQTVPADAPDDTDRPGWTVPLFRYTSI